MFRWKKWLILLVAMPLSLHVAGCRKEKGKEKEKEKELAAKEAIRKRADARARTACEKTVRDFLNAVAAKDFTKAVEFIDVEEMVRQGHEEAAISSASPPPDSDQMRRMLISMMEKAVQRTGELSQEILGSEVSGDEATVETELYKEGKSVDKRVYELARSDGKWRLSGSSAVRALLPPREMPPLRAVR